MVGARDGEDAFPCFYLLAFRFHRHIVFISTDFMFPRARFAVVAHGDILRAITDGYRSDTVRSVFPCYCQFISMLTNVASLRSPGPTPKSRSTPSSRTTTRTPRSFLSRPKKTGRSLKMLTRLSPRRVRTSLRVVASRRERTCLRRPLRRGVVDGIGKTVE